MIHLVSVSDHDNACRELYDILLERDGDTVVNISNTVTPSFDEHCAFFEDHPYSAWYLIVSDDIVVGSIYLTKPPLKSTHGNEIGVFIKKEFRNNGFAKISINILIELHDLDSYYANINPINYNSISLFKSLGFELCQLTFKLNRTHLNDNGDNSPG